MTETAEYPVVQKANHKTEFEDWLFKKYTRDILTEAKRLKAADKRFKFKKKNYSLVDGKVA